MRISKMPAILGFVTAVAILGFPAAGTASAAPSPASPVAAFDLDDCLELDSAAAIDRCLGTGNFIQGLGSKVEDCLVTGDQAFDRCLGKDFGDFVREFNTVAEEILCRSVDELPIPFIGRDDIPGC